MSPFWMHSIFQSQGPRLSSVNHCSDGVCSSMEYPGIGLTKKGISRYSSMRFSIPIWSRTTGVRTSPCKRRIGITKQRYSHFSQLKQVLRLAECRYVGNTMMLPSVGQWLFAREKWSRGVCPRVASERGVPAPLAYFGQWSRRTCPRQPSRAGSPAPFCPGIRS